MSDTTKKETETEKKADKPEVKAKAKAAPKRRQAAAKPWDKKETESEPKPDPSKTTEKPLVTSNTEEGGISGVLWTLLLLAVLGGGGYATLPLWSPYVVDYLPELKGLTRSAPKEDLLIDRVADMEREITKVRESGLGIADLEKERVRLNQSIEGVMTRIDDIEKQIDYVKGMLQATSPPSDAVVTNESLQRLSSRMNELERNDGSVNVVMERLARLETAMGESGANANSSAEQLSQTMSEISARLGALEQGVADKSQDKLALAENNRKQIHAQTLVLAVGHLRETLKSSAPFTAALDALKSLGGDDPDIQRGINELAPYAASGIPTMDMLRRNFRATADAISATGPEAATSRSGAVEGVLDRAWDRLSSLVSVRKTGTQDAPAANQGPILLARNSLDDGDLASAIDALSTLYGAEAEAAKPWLEGARARLTAETTLARMHVFVVSLLAPENR